MLAMPGGENQVVNYAWDCRHAYWMLCPGRLEAAVAPGSVMLAVLAGVILLGMRDYLTGGSGACPVCHARASDEHGPSCPWR